MSAFITFAILTKEGLTGLGKNLPDIDTYLENEAQVVAELPDNGYSFGPLLVLLAEKRIDLSDADNDPLMNKIAGETGQTFLIADTKRRAALIRQLNPANFKEADLGAFYERFTEVSDQQSGQDMLAQIKGLQESLKKIKSDEEALVILVTS